MKSHYQLAQVNIARLKAPKGDPSVSEFFDNVDKINALAESSNGFVWRFIGDYEPDPMLLFNISVWESIEQLAHFAYKTEHVNFVRKRGDWFVPMQTPQLAMWWVQAGETPQPEQCLRRLKILEEKGPTPRAFTFQTRFSAQQED